MVVMLDYLGAFRSGSTMILRNSLTDSAAPSDRLSESLVMQIYLRRK